MSINLIPKQEKKKMLIEFHFRLFILFLVVLDFCLFVLSISVFPSFFFSLTQKNVVEELKITDPLPKSSEGSVKTLEDINKKLSLAEKSSRSRFEPSSEVIGAILSKKQPNVKISQIFFENDPTLGKKVTIGGTAPSREVLLNFRQALEESAEFKEVNLPISNFVKGSNIEFSLGLTLK